MVTARGWWFLTFVAFLIVLGSAAVPYYSVVPVLLGLTLLAWFAVEWIVFQSRLNGSITRLRAWRRIVQGGRDVPMVWSGLAFEIRVEIHTNAMLGLPFLVLEDRLPVIAELTDGENQLAVVLNVDESAEIRYTLKAPTPGVLRFEGIRVRFADLNGFFYHHRFLREETEYLVLPPLADDEGRQRATKRFNTLPPPGVHRFRRPGSGSELLDLRDYQPGDPPKMIAWRASARRDSLITKEYESDVPVRSVLFLDTSDGMRLGPPGNTPLSRMVAIASSVSQAAAGNRDLVGLTTFDSEQANATKPARTKLHMIQIMRQLAEVASLQPNPNGVPPEELTRRVFPLAHELYPEAMAKKVNTVPLRRKWIPLLDRKYGGVVLALMLAMPFLLTIAIQFVEPNLLKFFLNWARHVADAAASLTPRGWFWPVKLAWILTLFTLFFFPLFTLGLVFWFFHGIRGWFGERSFQLNRRKRVAALFALQDGTGAGGIERLIHDDEAYAERVGQFLQRHQLRCPVPLYDDAGRYRFRCPEKSRVLANAIVRSVSRARDNEMYVIMADLIELGEDLDPLLRAARVARSRHHQMLVIIPWPADVPPPPDAESNLPSPELGRPNDPRANKNRRAERVARASGLKSVVQMSLTRQYHDSFKRLRRALGQVGATVVRVNEGDPVRLILDRLDRLRGLRSRR